MDIYFSYYDFWAMRLSKAGYGDIMVIKNLDIKTFIDLIHYENYNNEYQAVMMELNGATRK